MTAKAAASSKRPAAAGPKPGWHVVGSVRCKSVEKYGLSGRWTGQRFTFNFDENGDAEALAKLLNRLDRPKAKPRAAKDA